MENRRKLSTTIGANSYAYLHKMVRAGKAKSVGEAVDLAVQVARRVRNRATLEYETAEYFRTLSPGARAEEAEIENALSGVSEESDFDRT